MKLNKIGFSISLFVMLVSLTSCERTSQIYYEYDYVRDAYSAYSDLPLDERKYVSNDIEIPKIYLDRPVVEVRAYTFYGWKSLTNVKLPEGLKVIGAYSFSECLALNSIDIPSTVNIIDSCAFSNSGITDITLPEKLNYLGIGAFMGCDIASFKVSSENVVFDTNEDINAIVNRNTNVFIAGNKNSKIPDYVTTIESYAFYNVKGLGDLVLPSGITRINDMAFYGSEMKSITISNSIEYIGYDAFSDASIETINYAGTYLEFMEAYSNSSFKSQVTLKTTDGDYTLS